MCARRVSVRWEAGKVDGRHLIKGGYVYIKQFCERVAGSSTRGVRVLGDAGRFPSSRVS